MADKLTIDTPDGRVESECEIVEGTGNLFLTAKIDEYHFSMSHVPTGMALAFFVDRESAAQFGRTVYQLLTEDQRAKLVSTDSKVVGMTFPVEISQAARLLNRAWAHLNDLATECE